VANFDPFILWDWNWEIEWWSIFKLGDWGVGKSFQNRIVLDAAIFSLF